MNRGVAGNGTALGSGQKLTNPPKSVRRRCGDGGEAVRKWCLKGLAAHNNAGGSKQPVTRARPRAGDRP